MADQFHYPHDLLDLLVETIPRLVKSKKDVILFFEGAGVDAADLRDARATLAKDAQSIKSEIMRDVIAWVAHMTTAENGVLRWARVSYWSSDPGLQGIRRSDETELSALSLCSKLCVPL
ncbi:hypothetical protein [Pseudomonas salomonii]|uniref:hypothetical protein n=1 Tax=Pseudomonas salomonii TaxID=191391 RepID=UPI001FD38156|nr:hypothetical protein [Pseudomonas salomonii]